jgi:flagellar motor component MotA
MATINKTVKELPQLPAGLVEQLANFVNTEQVLRLITKQLMKQVIERTLQVELRHHKQYHLTAYAVPPHI